MKMSELPLAKPSAEVDFLIKVFLLLSVFLIGYLHFIIGPSLEFHLFFLIPIIIAFWFTNVLFSCFILSTVIFSWAVGDYLILEGNVNLFPFLFNTTIHALMLVYIAYLLRYIRHLLVKESQLAREDSLTKIPNRRSFYENAEISFSTGHRQQLPITIIFIDIDNFKSINDTYGHKIGDQLLCDAAQVMSENVRKNDVIGRLGGDEFCLILLGVDSAQAQTYAVNLRRKLYEKMQSHDWPTTFSMGVVTYGVTPSEFLTAIEQADKLMYVVKSNGRNGFLHEYYP